jgi:8-oxo-dGTP diphosphatase
MGSPVDPILAAGGILINGDGHKIAVVERARYPGETALPKGKIKEGETTVDAAKREILEETGCEGKNLEFVGTISYSVGSRPKIVFFYKMELARDHSTGPKDKEEIADFKWMRPMEAAQKLTHEEARNLVTVVFGLPSNSIRKPESMWGKVRRAWRTLLVRQNATASRTPSLKHEPTSDVRFKAQVLT